MRVYDTGHECERDKENITSIQRRFSRKGRANRIEWWLTLLVSLFVLHVIATLFGALTKTFPQVGVLFTVLFAIAVFFALWLCFATSVRRCHDLTKSGGWLFVFIIPIIGTLPVLVVLGSFRGSTGPNCFGPNPRNTLDADL